MNYNLVAVEVNQSSTRFKYNKYFLRYLRLRALWAPYPIETAALFLPNSSPIIVAERKDWKFDD